MREDTVIAAWRTRTDSYRRYGALSGRHPASIETSRACADYHKHLYMRQRIILAYPTTAAEGARRCRQRLVLARVTTQPGADRQAGRQQAQAGDACRWPSGLATYLRVPVGLTSRRHASLIDL